MSPRISALDINTVDYWDAIYAHGKFPTAAPNNAERYRAAASLQVGETALDIGCGQGGLGKALALQHPDVFYLGVDFSQEALDSTVHPSGSYLCMDWRDLGPSLTVDTVYLLEILEHVDDPPALLATAAALATRRFVVGVPRYGLIPLRLHRGEHQWDFTTEELLELLAPYGTVGTPIPAGLECCVVGVDR